MRSLEQSRDRKYHTKHYICTLDLAVIILVLRNRSVVSVPLMYIL